MSTLALDRPIVRTISLNVLLCAAIAAVPSLSHLTALPLYRFEPMRLVLFVAILATNRRNALLLAVGMPLFSLLTSGHPAFPKLLLIQGELALNTLIFYALVRGQGRFVLGATVSILASKIAYYLAKFLLLRFALLEGQLVSTPWRYQLLVLAFILLVGGWLWQRRERRVERAA